MEAATQRTTTTAEIDHRANIFQPSLRFTAAVLQVEAVEATMMMMEVEVVDDVEADHQEAMAIHMVWG